VVNVCPFEAFGVLSEYISILDGRDKEDINKLGVVEESHLQHQVDDEVSLKLQRKEENDVVLTYLKKTIKKTLDETKCHTVGDSVEPKQGLGKLNCNVMDKKVEHREYVGKLGCDVVDDESVIEEQVVGESKYDVFLSRKSECDAKGVNHFSELENREKSLTLLAKWSNANQVHVSIQVNSKRYNHPLISIQQELSNISMSFIL